MAKIGIYTNVAKNAIYRSVAKKWHTYLTNLKTSYDEIKIFTVRLGIGEKKNLKKEQKKNHL